MKTIHRTIHVTPNEATEANRLLRQGFSEPGRGPNERIMSWTTDFGGGIEIDVNIYNAENGPWGEAVVFNNNNQVDCSDVDDDIFREWTFELEGFTLCVRCECLVAS